jgi:hypothetical protein
MMTRNNFTPWTKFPTSGGHFFEENFAFWKNPYACRDRADVHRNWNPNLVYESAGLEMVPKDDYSHMNTDKWTKFWYTVDQLHDWVHGMKTIDDIMLQHFVGAYYNGIKSIFMENGVLERYENAGLLDEDGDWHKNLFRNFRDAQQEHFRLSVDEKEELRDELLAEKAKVM